MEKKHPSQSIIPFRLAIASAVAFLFVVVVAGMPSSAHAATLQVVSTNALPTAGGTFSVNISVTSDDQAANAISGELTFPVNMLKVVSVSKTDSIFSMWVQDPTYSNTNGTVDFAGIVLNPGFTGDGGQILHVVFKALTSGPAQLTFTGASVLANDGKGTNILVSASPSILTIQPALSSPADSTPLSASPSAIAGAPQAPDVSSSITPDPSAWYSTTTTVLTWDVPSDVTAEAYTFDHYSSTIPDKAADTLSNEAIYSNLTDGTWYFHLQFKNSHGWGAVTHFRVRIDTTPPVQMKIVFPHGSTSLDPRPVILFNTTDSLSGIDHYLVRVNNGQDIDIDGNVLSNPYPLPEQDPGSGTVLVQAFDKAGNSTIATASFTVLGIDAPQLDALPQTITEGDLLRIEGNTYPGATVTVTIEDAAGDASSQDVVSSAVNGHFWTVWTKKLSAGAYTMVAMATDQNGAKSNKTSPVTFVIDQSVFFHIGSLAITYTSFIVLAIIFIAGILVIGWYLWRVIVRFRRIINNKIYRSEVEIHELFSNLKEEVAEHIHDLEKAKSKRTLSSEEERLIVFLREDLTRAEQRIRDKIERILR
jgi:Bacterial Ig-like domain